MKFNKSVIKNCVYDASLETLADIDVTDTSTKITAGKTFSSTQLFKYEKAVAIQHHNETYYLRITKQNKLILTK